MSEKEFYSLCKCAVAKYANEHIDTTDGKKLVTTATLCVFTLYIPPTIGIRDNMMFFSCHIAYPLCALGQQIAQPSASA